MSDFLIKALIIVFGFLPLGILTAGFAISVVWIQTKEAAKEGQR